MEFKKVQEIISEILNIGADEITLEASFVEDLGADSLDVFQIIMGIEEEFDLEIMEEEVKAMITVNDAVEYIKSAIEA